MDITMSTGADGTAAKVAGEADADNCHELGSALTSDTITGPLRVDLAALTFLDSSAVSELLRILEVLAGRNITMTVENPSPAVRRVLEITGLLDVFGINPG